jgi:hypothetical protein
MQYFFMNPATNHWATSLRRTRVLKKSYELSATSCKPSKLSAAKSLQPVAHNISERTSE